jgi:tetratricopeptide (TPR) repeat protein
MIRLIVAACCLLFTSTVFAQKVGDIVVVIAEKGAELKVGNDVIGTVPRGSHLQIGVIDGLFGVNYRGARGWIPRSDVIHIDKSIDYFTKAIRRNPTADDYVNRGMMWKGKREYDKAISDCNEAIRLNPKYSSYYYSRGHVWERKAEHDKAISDYNEAIRLDPNYSGYYSSRGHAWEAKGEYDKAISDYTEAIRLSPKYSILYLSFRGGAWEAKGEYDKAISDYNEAIRLDPKDFYAYRIRSWIRSTCPDARYRDGQKALVDARKACELTEWKVLVCINTLAAAYAENNDFDEVIKWQKKAIKVATAMTRVRAKEKADLQTRLELYKSGKPYREKPKK